MNKCLKTMIISLLLIIAMPMAKLSAQVSTWDGTWEPWTQAAGTEADPFLIENAQQLAYLAYRVNNGLDANGGHVSNHNYHYKLMVDVNLNGSESFQWDPIGYWNSNTDYQCFGGQFDGNNHAVSGLYINSSAKHVGFFGYVDGATIMDLTVTGTMVSTSDNDAGGVVGFAISPNIMNCSTSFMDGVFASSCAGGIVGFSAGTVTITNCHNTGTVSAIITGGILGDAASTATITNCYNTGVVSTPTSYYFSCSGGILGDASSTTITNCYNTGAVSASAPSSYFCGGIVGLKNNGTVTNSYYRNTCGGDNTYGGQSMSSDAMKTSEFVSILNNGTDVWMMDTYYVNQGYPIFSNMPYFRITTLDATGITQTHATLRGEAFSTETITSQGFEYRKTSETNFQSVSVSNSGEMSKIISGLTPGTLYIYHTFCMVDGLGTFYGQEKTFNTLTINVTTYSASNVTGSSATLNGHIDAGDAEVTDKGFKYWPTNDPQNVSTVSVSTTGNISATINNLAQNIYQYRAFAESEGDMYQGGIKEFEISWLNSDTIFVYDADKLHWVAEQCNSGVTFEGKCVKLMNDIELPFNVPNNMISIGSYPNYPFKGTFDGNRKLISNLYIDQPNTPYQGFFGYTLNAYLYNVGLVNITASGRNYTGGMVAYAKNTYMRDCYVNGGTLFALSYCGGLVGYQEQGTNSIISGCYNTCEVTGNNYVGGLIGFSNYSTVRNSYVAGRVAAQGEPVGAIIGGANDVLMYYCYFSIDITGQTVAIGENNFKDGEGLTNEQMRDPQFVATLNQGLVVPVWKPDYETPINNGFPIIVWQEGGTTIIEEDIAAMDYISLYPNPTNGHVTIEAENLKHITISNLLGQVVYKGKVEGDAFEYDFDRHGEGLYLIRIGTTSGVVTKKVSVTR